MDDFGIVMLAQNNDVDDYVLQACVNAMSIATTNPGIPVSLITNDEVPEKYQRFFDQIIEIPWNDSAEEESWKISNRWKIYHVTPYTRTLVLDTDMLVLQDIDSWIKFLENYEMYFVSNVYTYRGDKITDDYYRKAFTANELPNLYSGFHYFKKCDFSHKFYTWLELVVNNWEFFYGQYVKEHYPKRCSIDVSAAIVSKILDCDTEITNTRVKFPSFTHMKPRIQDWYEAINKWQNRISVYMDEDCKLKLGNHIQTGILHYTEKDFIEGAVIKRYEELLDV